MTVPCENFGVLPTGETVHLYTLENKKGMKAQISDLGCALVRLWVPDAQGNLADVVLGHATADGYAVNPTFFGAFIGRSANRIKGAAVEIDGVTYQLAKNDGDNNLHSVPHCMGLMMFEAEPQTIDGSPALVLSRRVADGEDGFPGNLDVRMTYILTEDNALILDYHAVSDKATFINLTNHSYFNLAGHDSGDVSNHILQLNASFYTPNGRDCIPTGEILSVEGTPFDFREAKPIGQDIAANHPQVKMFGGYDHNIVLDGRGYRKIAIASDPKSGRIMECWTDQPGVQLYSANSVSGSGKDGVTYGKHHAFCLETQVFPNAAAMPWVVSPLYKAGEVYATRTAYIFR